MGWFSDAVDSVADVVTGAAEAVTDAVTDVVETTGSVLEDGLGRVGTQVGKIPAIGGFLGGVFSCLGRSLSAGFDLLGGVIKGVSSIVTGSASGLIRILGGSVSLDRSLIFDGFRDVGAGILGGLVIIGGRLLSFTQTVSYFLQPNKRPLSEDEKKLLGRVFGDSISPYNIRLVEGFAGVFSLNDRPFTLANTIFLKDRVISNELDLLVHECVHVWQYQGEGARYAGDALGAQWFGNEYEWEKEIEEGRTDWADFNKESQGKFLEHLYDYGELTEGSNTTKGAGAFYDSDGHGKVGSFFYNADHTVRANDAVIALRAGNNYRISRFI